MSGVSLLLAFALLGVSAAGVALTWELPVVLYITMFAVGILGLILSFVFAIKKTLHFRVGQLIDLNELNDLRNKVEKYNITNKK